MRKYARALAAAAACAAGSISGAARAGNLDSFYFGGEGALQGGAITADALGGGAIWYNPAGLARMPGLRIDVSVNAYALRFGGHPDFSAGLPGTRVERLTTLDLNVVPSALTVTRNFGPVGLGLGVFVPAQRTTFLRTQILKPEGPDNPGVRLGLDLYERTQEYAAGPSFGVTLHPAVDFGASLLFDYRTLLSTASINGSTSSRGEETAFLDHATVDVQQVGARLVLGVKLRPGRASRIGFTLRLPAWQFYEVRQSVNQELSSDGSSPAAAAFDGRIGVTTSVLSPARFHCGYSRDFGPTRIAADVSYQAPLRGGGTEQDFTPVLNARLGGRRKIAETVAVGGGIFTDRSPARTPQRFGDAKLHYYGVTAALEFGQPYTVSARGSKRLDPPGVMIFGTTIGVSYALGLGDIVRAQVGTSADSAVFFQEVPSRVVAHEFTLHIASALME